MNPMPPARLPTMAFLFAADSPAMPDGSRVVGSGPGSTVGTWLGFGEVLVIGRNEIAGKYVGIEVDEVLEEVMSRENDDHADDVTLEVRLDGIGVEVVMDVSRDVIGTVDDVSVVSIDGVGSAGGDQVT